MSSMHTGAAILAESPFEESVFAAFEALYAVRDGASAGEQLVIKTRAIAKHANPAGALWQQFAEAVAEALSYRLAQARPLSDQDVEVIDRAFHRFFECLQGAAVDLETVEAVQALEVLGWSDAATCGAHLATAAGLARVDHMLATTPEQDALSLQAESDDWDALLSGLDALLARAVGGEPLGQIVSAAAQAAAHAEARFGTAADPAVRGAQQPAGKDLSEQERMLIQLARDMDLDPPSMRDASSIPAVDQPGAPAQADHADAHTVVPAVEPLGDPLPEARPETHQEALPSLALGDGSIDPDDRQPELTADPGTPVAIAAVQPLVAETEVQAELLAALSELEVGVDPAPLPQPADEVSAELVLAHEPVTELPGDQVTAFTSVDQTPEDLALPEIALDSADASVFAAGDELVLSDPVEGPDTVSARLADVVTDKLADTVDTADTADSAGMLAELDSQLQPEAGPEIDAQAPSGELEPFEPEFGLADEPPLSMTDAVIDEPSMNLLREAVQGLDDEVLPLVVGGEAEEILAIQEYRTRLAQCTQAARWLGVGPLVALFERVSANLQALDGTKDLSETQRQHLILWPSLAVAYFSEPTPENAASWVEASCDTCWSDATDAQRAQLMSGLLQVRVGAMPSMQSALPDTLPDDGLSNADDNDPEVFGCLLRELPPAVMQLHQLAEQLEEQPALAVTLQRCAHTIKGMAHTAGLGALACLMHAVEEVVDLLGDDPMPPSMRMALVEAAEVAEQTADALTGFGRGPHGADGTYQTLLMWVRRLQPEGQAKSPPSIEETLPNQLLAGIAQSVPAALPAKPVANDHAAAPAQAAASPVQAGVKPVADADLSQWPQFEFASLAERAAAVLLREADRGPDVVMRVGALRVALKRVADLVPSRADVQWFALRRAAEHLCETFADVPVEAEQGRQLAEALRDAALQVRYESLDFLAAWFEKTVTQAARLVGKKARLVLDLESLTLERSVLVTLREALTHVLRNAVDHGLEATDRRRQLGKPEEGVIHLTIARDGERLLVRCADDGAGIDEAAVLRRARAQGRFGPYETPPRTALLRTVLEPGFTTRGAASALSGRGLGLDMVSQAIRTAGGTVAIDSEPGVGAAFVLALPLRRWVVQVMQVRVGRMSIAIPSEWIESVVAADDVVADDDGDAVDVDGQRVAVSSLADALGVDEDPAAERVVLVVRLRNGARHAWRSRAPLKLRVVGEPWPAAVATQPGLAGQAILPDGTVAALMDVPALIQNPTRAHRAEKPLMLVAHPVPAIRENLRRRGVDAGWRVRMVTDGLDALALARRTKPATVVMGRGLSRLDADELARVLKMLPDTAASRLVLMQAVTSTVAAEPFDLRTADVDAVLAPMGARLH